MLETLGPRIRRYRTERGLTGAQLADRVGVAQSYISAIETSKQLPSLPTLAQIAEELGVSINMLLLDGVSDATTLMRLIHELPSEEREDVFDYVLFKLQQNKRRIVGDDFLQADESTALAAALG